MREEILMLNFEDLTYEGMCVAVGIQDRVLK